MTTEITEGMPQKPGVLPGDDKADQWRDGQYGRYTYDNHVIDTVFMDMINKNPENTYFSYDGMRYKWQTKKSSDPSKWEDSRIIYESVSKFSTPTQTQKLPGNTMIAPPPFTKSMMDMKSSGITKEIMVRKIGEEFDHQLEINQILDSEEWTLFSTHVMGESLILTFIK